MSCNCCAILHSASDNSNARSSASRSAVIASITCRYSKANFNMSNVEFQRVVTSRGIMRIDSLSLLRHSFQRGRSLVVEWMILKASFPELWKMVSKCQVCCYMSLILTFTRTNRTGWNTLLQFFRAHPDRVHPSHLPHPSISSLSSLPSPTPHSAEVTNSSMSIPAASSSNCCSASSNAESASFRGTSNCFSSCLATRLMICKKASCAVGFTRKVVKECWQFVNHCVIVQRIVSGDAVYLF